MLLLVRVLRGRGVVAALGLVLALVLAVPPRAARAAVVTPPPVGVPGSVLQGTGGGYKTPGQWDAQLKAPQQSGKPYTVPGPSSSAGTGKVGVSAGAGAVAGIVGLQFGLDAGSQIAYAVGISETGSWSCDLRIALGGDCGVTADGSYVPNSDLGALSTSGWTSLPVVELPAQEFESGSGQVVTEVVRWSFDWIAEPAMAPGDSPAEWQWAASVVFAGQWFAPRHGMESRAYCRRASDGLVRLWDSRLASGGTPMQWNWAGSISRGVCSGGDMVERVELWVQDAMDLSHRVVATWHPEGSPLRPEVAPDPARWWRTSWLCESGTGGFALSDAFRESDPEWPGFPQAQCEGSALARIVIEQLTEGVAESQIIFEWETDPAFQEWSRSECARASSPCYLDLQRDTVSCFSSPDACAAWWAETQQGTSAGVYRCIYNGQTLALRECAVYAHLFDRGVYADPETGEAADRAPSPEPNPEPEPGPQPQPGPQPGPEPSDGCPPPFSWTSLFNPWWYYKSSVCALQDMFVPTQSATHITRINTAVGQTTVALWAAELDGMFAAPPSASGCQGPAMSINSFGINRTFYPFSACDAPMSTAAPWVRGVATGLVVVFGSMACVRALGAGFGWKPSAGGDS